MYSIPIISIVFALRYIQACNHLMFTQLLTPTNLYFKQTVQHLPLVYCSSERGYVFIEIPFHRNVHAKSLHRHFTTNWAGSLSWVREIPMEIRCFPVKTNVTNRCLCTEHAAAVLPVKPAVRHLLRGSAKWKAMEQEMQTVWLLVGRWRHVHVANLGVMRNSAT